MERHSRQEVGIGGPASSRHRLVIIAVAWTLVLGAGIERPTPARAYDRDGEICHYFENSDFSSAGHRFDGDSDAVEEIERIIGVAGIKANFEVRRGGVANAAAAIRGGQRYILYNEGFMEETEERTGTRWAATSILAHEIGHHLNGHTLDRRGSRPDIELEADYYSGFVLQRLGATLEDALAVQQEMGSERGSRTHPPRQDRLEAITEGWNCAADADCGGGSSASGRRPVAARTKPRRSGASDDGEWRTRRGAPAPRDSSRIWRGGAGSTPGMRMAQVCQTGFGACPLVAAGPPNMQCTCAAMGQWIPGISR